MPSTAIERDLNSTRIEARHRLMKSSLRVQKGIQYYSMKFRPLDFPDNNDWKALREVEGVLHACHPIVILSQYESKFLGGFGSYIKKVCYKQLCSGSLDLIDVHNWRLKVHPDRETVCTSEFTPIGKVSVLCASTSFTVLN